MITKVIAYYDYLLLIPYLIIFFLIARNFAKNHSETSREFYWLLINWWLKMAAGLVYVWLIVYYYGYGDPIGYKDRSDALFDSILENWQNIQYVFLPVESFRNYLSDIGYSSLGYTSDIAYYIPNNFMISRISAVIAFFTFNRFLLISLVFSNIAYYGFILIYTTCKKIIHGYNKELAIGCLFIPSCIYWSNGIAKEPVCMIALAIIFSSGVKLFFIKNRGRFLPIINLLFFSFVLFTVKSYIFLSFSIALLLWIMYNGIQRILSKSLFFKIVFFFFTIIFTGGIIYVFGQAINDLIVSAIGDIISTNIDLYEVMASVKEGGGSLIEVKNVDVASVGGILKFLPQGLVNVFFRPFPWEILNVLMIFTAVENSVFIILFIRMFYTSRIFTRGLYIEKNYQIFAIAFSIVLALAIGISTFNFGSMVRYKMPFLPFWASFLLIINKKLKRERSVVVL